MFLTLFPISHRRYSDSPAVHWLQGFAVWLVARGYSRKALRGHVQRLRQALERAGTVASDERWTSEQLTRLFEFPTHAHYPATEHNFRRYLMENGRLICEPEFGRFTSLLAAYRIYLLELCGLVPQTAKHHLDTVYTFLCQSLAATQMLNALSNQAVEAFIVATGQRLKRQTLKQTIGHLRMFLRYCYNHGDIPTRLDSIDSPRIYAGERPPRALAWDLAIGLLASIDISDPGGVRDHAMLYLIAYFGLRPSEVALLKLDSIDWRSRTLRVEQSKTRSSLVLPLPEEAIQVLKRYVRDGRPDSTHEALFLHQRAPAGALTSAAIRSVYRKRARQSGLPLDGSSPYSLRHGFAMRLLGRGVGIKTIGDLMGHRALESTCVYLRLQIDALREVGLPLPVSTAATRGAS